LYGGGVVLNIEKFSSYRCQKYCVFVVQHGRPGFVLPPLGTVPPQDTQYGVRELVKNLESVGSLHLLPHHSMWIAFDPIMFFLSP
jgi:hypothetical protein